MAPKQRVAGLAVERYCSVNLLCHGVVAGKYSTGLLVEDMLLVEPKVIKELNDVRRMRCTNYLEATDPSLCLSLNIGKPCLEIKRVFRGR